MVSFLAGRKFSVQGDSISALFGNAWQNVVITRTGMTYVSADARAGRNFATSFECYGVTTPGATLGVFDPTIMTPYGSCAVVAPSFTAGSTLAQSMANVDLLIIELGTNDLSLGLGQPGDSTSAGTFYGNMRWVVETYLTAKPAMRVVMVTPGYRTDFTSAAVAQYANAMVSYGNSVGVPVINMLARGGGNAQTATTVLRDYVHPSDFGFANFYGPVIAQSIQQNF